MSINKRVVQLIEKTSVSKVSFSEATGISTVIISHISSGRNKVSLTTVKQILKAFNDVNAKWLIFGHGSMFESKDNSNKFDELDQQIKRLKSNVELQHIQLNEQVVLIQKLLLKIKRG